MRISWTYRVFAVTMAILVGLSSISWTIVQHYCQGALHKVSLVIDTTGCHEPHVSDVVDSQAKTCCIVDNSDHSDCCTDQVDVLDHDTTVIQPSDDLLEDGVVHGVVYAAIDLKTHWPLAKINPIRGPTLLRATLSSKFLSIIQNWRL